MYKNIHNFNDDEVARIIRDVKEKIYSNVRDKLILIFLFDTGIRVGELCNIKNEDVTYKQIKIRYSPNDCRHYFVQTQLCNGVND
ncbi:site-specific integrase [Bacillus mycoides]|uniref:tyrosine-type recombinase/integrase n=1 Tax=Bacillus mycoides TaxID=1405 RepID=UPI0010394D8C|nr:site-specific integrase [Bacillus mycoides]TBX83305.1 site-specific integrase [Bacillus mycoides]